MLSITSYNLPASSMSSEEWKLVVKHKKPNNSNYNSNSQSVTNNTKISKNWKRRENKRIKKVQDEEQKVVEKKIAEAMKPKTQVYRWVFMTVCKLRFVSWTKFYICKFNAISEEQARQYALYFLLPEYIDEMRSEEILSASGSTEYSILDGNMPENKTIEWFINNVKPSVFEGQCVDQALQRDTSYMW